MGASKVRGCVLLSSLRKMNLNSPWVPDPAEFSELADGFRVVRYIAVATYAAWLWDSCLTLSDDIRLFREFRSSLTDVVYLFSRFVHHIFAGHTSEPLLQPECICVSHCNRELSVHSHTTDAGGLRFLEPIRRDHDGVQVPRRCQANDLAQHDIPSYQFTPFRDPHQGGLLFYDSKIIQGFFAILWLSVLGGALIQPFCVTFNYLDVFHTCVATTVRPYCTSGAITVMVHDTMALLAISTKIILQTFVGSWKERLKTFFSTNEMPQVSRLLMRTGQQYYFVTVMANVVTLSVMLNPAFSPIYRAVSFVPNLAVYNIMACRIYRGMKLGFIEEGGKSTISRSGAVTGRSTLRFTSTHGAQPLSSGDFTSYTGTQYGADI